MKKRQILVVGGDMEGMNKLTKSYFEEGFKMVPESLRLVLNDVGQALIAVIMEKEPEDQ